MKQISKAEFIRRITNGKSIHIGISPVCDESEIRAVRNRIDNMHYCERTAKAKGMHIIFSNDSNLYLDNTKNLEIKCYEEEDNILIVEQKFTSQYYGFPDEVTYKYLYYLQRLDMVN